MIRTLLVTILIEGSVVLLFCAIKKKPVGSTLLASLVVNLFTQTILWVWLGIFHRFYIAALLIAEIFVWVIEGLLMSKISSGRLNYQDAFGLSFYMNLASFGIGLFLPF